MRTKYCRTVAPFTAALIAVVVGAAGSSGQQRPEDQVEAVVSAFHAAIVAGDSTTALGHLAEDVTILESGRAQNKEEYRSGHLAGDMRFAGAVPSERGDMEVRLMGEVAWTYSTSIRQGRMGDRDINSASVELMVLAREVGVWKIRAIHWSSRQRR